MIKTKISKPTTDKQKVKALDGARSTVLNNIEDCQAFIFLGMTDTNVIATVVGEHDILIKGVAAEFKHSEVLPKLIQEALVYGMGDVINSKISKITKVAKRTAKKKAKSTKK